MPALIPLRPKDFATKLSQDEQSCLTWYVLSGCSRKDAFITFARPDMLNSKAKAAIDDYVKQFYARVDVKEYVEAYRATIDDLLHPPKGEGKPTGTIEERKAKAKTKLVEFAMTLANDIDRADDPEFVLKIADKAGLLEGDDNVEEQPRRYLPVTCGECEYRKFVEENCERVEGGTDLALPTE